MPNPEANRIHRSTRTRRLPSPSLGLAGLAAGLVLVTAGILYLLVSWLEGFGVAPSWPPGSGYPGWIAPRGWTPSGVQRR